eukprot:CAMPEP_0114573880 /NCGR_PEP_ID=MMETSP0114-20121206/19100_1 /TAXON_ID=31324 /ORGANISM="Goniomonas sp, Strain m" /LENGTH=228 /DNA_ID=CAMNT_0001761265 /DNA_START=224 /DNA_END=911 /DNA_ORIENTATION=+
MGLQNLDAATFQILSQLKIVFTAVFSVVFLRRHLHLAQWCSLGLLTIGAALLNLPECPEFGIEPGDGSMAQRLTGLSCVVVLCVLSGFAGIYTEKHLKLTLAFFGAVCAAFGVWGIDGEQVGRLGFFHGYDGATYAVVGSFAAGGMIVSAVVKASSTVTKVYASTVSIVLTIVGSSVVYHGAPTHIFWCAASIVIISVILYNSQANPSRPNVAMVSTGVQTEPHRHLD